MHQKQDAKVDELSWGWSDHDTLYLGNLPYNLHVSRFLF